ncbi:MAG: HAMP domain-containing histidine kinase [Oscillospiraceae bacterium]|nr:HAMP domain-containing histidine kinase [Oscillospiraceae bacterium]
MAQERKHLTHGLTRRWIFNVLSIFFVVLTLIAVTIISLIGYNYLHTARLAVQSNNAMTEAFFLSRAGGAAAYGQTAQDFLASFGRTDRMEVWVIDENGRVVASSGGPPPSSVSMPDYVTAQSAIGGSLYYGHWAGTREPILAYTAMLPAPYPPGCAVRYIVSLEDVIHQIFVVAMVTVFFSLVFLALVTSSGLFFVRSILYPMENINKTAQRIAAGDYDARVDLGDLRVHRDELTQLCVTVNHMAEEINTSQRLKSDFVSTISHELRTPLTAIKGWGETLLQIGGSDAAMTRRGMEVIISESGRLTQLVEDLLDFSHIQSGRMIMRKTAIDVLAELDETLFSFRDRALREGIELIYAASDLPAPMQGDASRIRQVFVNILDNAFKYTPQDGKVHVTADVRSDVLTVQVADTGCGIAPEDLPRIREKFYKSASATRGSGIGLAIVDEILRQHDASLSFESELGLGTTVTLRFPLTPEKGL